MPLPSPCINSGIFLEPNNTKNTIAIRTGAQYKLTTKIAARLGFAYGITPVQNGYVTPETPDANRINYTAGLGYELGKHFKLDASFLFTTNFILDLSEIIRHGSGPARPSPLPKSGPKSNLWQNF